MIEWDKMNILNKTFINEDKINELISKNSTDKKIIDEILNKALSAKGISLEESAHLPLGAIRSFPSRAQSLL